MPPKTKYTKGDIVQAAFEIAQEEGFAAITARSVAAKLGCSVAPIYVNFETIDDLAAAVMQRVNAISASILAQQSGKSPFENLGKASLQFAREYPVLVRELILKPNPHLANYEAVDEALVAGLADDEELRAWSDDERRKLVFVMRAFQTGLMVLLANGHVPKWLGPDEAENLLMSTGADLVIAGNHKRNGGNIR